MKNVLKQKKIIVSLLGFLLLAGCATQLSSQDKTGMPAQTVYAMPSAGNDIIGQVYKVKAQPGDTLVTLAQRYDVGAQQLTSVNPRLRSGHVPSGATVIIPAQYILPPANFRKGIVINIAELRLYYFANNTVMTFPVAVGREGWATPLLTTYVYRKAAAPTWNVPKSIRDDYFAKTGKEHPKQVAPGPENPLGEYALYLQMNGYLIHGNNAPETIGRRVSSGCVRMFNPDVKKLYDIVNRGTPVNFIYYPYKAGWSDGKLYLESHLPLGQMPADSKPENSATMKEAIDAALREKTADVNWKAAERVAKNHSGIPTEIGQQK